MTWRSSRASVSRLPRLWLACLALASAAGCAEPARAAALATAEAQVQPPQEPELPPTWPDTAATLLELELPAAVAGERKPRIYLDPGHAAPKPSGNTSVFCEPEHAVSLKLALELEKVLLASGRFEVKVSRRGDARVPYAARMKEAEAWKAALLVGLHSDVRNSMQWWSPQPDVFCPRQDDPAHRGFAVLYSDEGSTELVGPRHRAAQQVALRMAEVGFHPYDGADYLGLYDGDVVSGVFVDRREPLRTRVFMLRKPKVPAIIVETHHAWDFREASRWREAKAIRAFAAALGGAALTRQESVVTAR